MSTPRRVLPASLLPSGLSPTARVLCAGAFVNRLGTTVPYFLVLYLRSRGFTLAQAGTALSAYGIGVLGSGPLGGWLNDRAGARRTIAAGAFLNAGLLAALSRPGNYPALLVIATAAGVAADLYKPAAAALLASSVPPDLRRTAFAIYRLGVNAGFAVGGVLAGVIVAASLSSVFLLDGITALAFGAAALRWLPARSAVPQAGHHRGPGVGRDHRFLLFLAAAALAGFVTFQQYAAIPLQVRSAGLPASTVGAMLAFHGVLVVLLQLVALPVTGRLPSHPATAVGLVLLAAGIAATGLAHSVGPLLATVLVWTVGETLFAPAAVTVVAEAAPPGAAGRYQGAFLFAFGTGQVSAPVLDSLLLSRAAPALWWLCLASGPVAAVLARRGTQHRS